MTDQGEQSKPSETEHISKIRILHVEDNQALAGLVAASLSQDADITHVNNADDGINILQDPEQRKNIDLVITDFNLPGSKTGLDVTRAAGATEEFGKIPVVMLSANVDLSKQQAALQQQGVTLLMLKPFSPRVLREKVNDFKKS